MDTLSTPADIMFLASAFVLLLLTTNRALDLCIVEADEDDNGDCELQRIRDEGMGSAVDTGTITRGALHHLRVCNVFNVFDSELGYWVKPRSTTWFSRFLLDQYDDDRWVKMFRISKPTMFMLADLLKPILQKKDTHYRLAIPVVVRVACTLFKLTHGASLLICSELFAVGRSTVSLLLRQVVHTINVALRSEITWPTGQKLVETQAKFYELCGLPGVAGAIDGTHVEISKPKFSPADYFYFKSGGYTLNCLAVVDSRKRFIDLFLGMPGLTNDARCLRRSTLYDRGMQSSLWEADLNFDGFTPFLIGDSSFPLMPWLMVPHQGQRELPLAQSLFNRKLRRGRGVMENAFGILKQTFRELLTKSDLDVAFLPDVITCCCILHNILLGQSHEQVHQFFQVLRTEGLEGNVLEDENALLEVGEALHDDAALELASEKRRDLGFFLALQRNVGV